jgi:hypothetical protein
MKKIIILLFIISGLSANSFSQLQVGGGPAMFYGAKSLNDGLIGYDYSVFLGYDLHKFNVGFEFIQNGYKDGGNGKEYYHFYQYQAFGKYYPFKRKTLFVKGGTNITDEFYHTPINRGNEIIVTDERGTLLGFEGGIGYQDRLIKKIDLFINVSLTYNHLFLIKDDYYFNHHREIIPFYALKISLLYQFNFKNN